MAIACEAVNSGSSKNAACASGIRSAYRSLWYTYSTDFPTRRAMSFTVCPVRRIHSRHPAASCSGCTFS